jgi:hypothetical protein
MGFHGLKNLFREGFCDRSRPLLFQTFQERDVQAEGQFGFIFQCISRGGLSGQGVELSAEIILEGVRIRDLRELVKMQAAGIVRSEFKELSDPVGQDLPPTEISQIPHVSVSGQEQGILFTGFPDAAGVPVHGSAERPAGFPQNMGRIEPGSVEGHIILESLLPEQTLLIELPAGEKVLMAVLQGGFQGSIQFM